MAITTSDFSGVLVIKAPSATAANNAAGQICLEATSSYTFLSFGSVAVGGSTAQNELIAVEPMFPCSHKKLVDVAKTAGTAWVAGQAIYLITATGIFITTSGTGKVLFGIAANDAASAATVGNLIPSSPK